MLSVGIDVSKEKSTVCGMRHLGEIVFGPFEIAHTESDLSELARMIVRLDDDTRVVMEATGIYHLPVATFLREQGLFVTIINPYEMKVYRSQDIRKVKTDKRDSMVIANYGVDKWINLREFTPQEDVYAELRLLGRQYRFYMESRIEQLLNLTHLLDYTLRAALAAGVSIQVRISYVILLKNIGITTTSLNSASRSLWRGIRNGQRKRDTSSARQKQFKSTDSRRKVSQLCLLTHHRPKCCC